jgi:hypothetical protein
MHSIQFVFSLLFHLTIIIIIVAVKSQVVMHKSGMIVNSGKVDGYERENSGEVSFLKIKKNPLNYYFTSENE